MSFQALLVTKDDAGKTSASIKQLDVEQLPEGDVIVAVAGQGCSTVEALQDRVSSGPAGHPRCRSSRTGSSPTISPNPPALCGR